MINSWGMKPVRSTIRTLLLVTTASVISFSGIAQAQQVAQADLETERDLQRQRERQERISKISGPDGFGPLLREVTFQEILADPDNIELNVLYARTQIKHGHMDKAQATLERILLIEPDLTIVKMLYGLVLFRLDNMAEAETVFNELLAADISENDRVVAQSYLDQIEKSKKRLAIKFTVSAGLHYDDNRTSAPKSGELWAGGLVFAADPEQSDWGGVINLGGEARYDLGYQRPHEAYAKVTLVGDDQHVENSYDLLMARTDLGVVLAYDIGRVDLSINQSTMNLGGKAYMTSPGAKVRWDANPNSAYVPYAQVSATHQYYRDDTNAERNGLTLSAILGGSTNTLVEGGITDASITHTLKTSNEDYYAYTAWGADLSHTQVFDQGRFLIGSAGASVTDYEAADTFLSSENRRDVSITLGLTAGAPLGGTPAGEFVPDNVKDVLVTATIERTMARSNIPNYAYNNWRGQMMLTKSFGF